MQLNISNRVSLFLWTVLLTCSGFLISHQLIYYLLILPQTLGGNIIRSFWWPLSHVPILIACIYLGSRIRSFPELTVATAGSFLATILFLLAENGFNLRVELGLGRFSFATPLMLLLYLPLYFLTYGTVWLINRYIHRVRQL